MSIRYCSIDFCLFVKSMKIWYTQVDTRTGSEPHGSLGIKMKSENFNSKFCCWIDISNNKMNFSVIGLYRPINHPVLSR